MKKIRLELVYLRAIICAIIIITHLLTQITLKHENMEGGSLVLQFYIRNIVIFGTPCFIILSQLLTTLNYQKVTYRYLTTRVKYILIPYILMGLFYSYSESLLTDSSFNKQFIENVLLGQWYGYFIVVIMQFFILSYIIFKINYYPLSENTIIFGWIFYFFLGAYMGYNYERVLNFLERYLVIMIVLAVATYFVFIALANGDYWNVTSFSYSLTPYNSIMFIVILGICTHFKTMLFNTIQMISAFSFFIYLLHPIILDSLFAYTNIFEDNTMVFLAISLLFILGLCIGVGMILREFYIFRFIIGKQPYKLNINAY
ncbi:polysaccharide intercellular adhesin biosynthesis/export protein IcaC [Staphylococcus aureus]|uniref:polysaccharide intercellular adhesin biosynthesis/export protein IcaC n=1 Tax=Staphylococcus aureus TaxID=1280 RepID=UPI000390BAF7|nr:polysaccharide intercellular adhesin biosynthesis/export protein IcaC [Staphylococcus aureus]ERE94834.1 acyltransferase domain protein [Staphylococcus aureus subsp. aureus CO-08]